MQCNQCKKEKPDVEFYFFRGKPKNPCKECATKREKIRYHGAYKERSKMITRNWQKEHPERMRELNRASKLRRREKVFGYYGKKCVCCGETEYRFLTIDHINNDGAKHKKERGGVDLYDWIIKNNFPKTFQVLCWNCNCSKGHYGQCPHKKL